MNDRELLERAASAAGIELEGDLVGNPGEWQPMYYEGKTYHSWNSLADDGDALRLGVEMCMFDESSKLATQFQWNLAVAQGQTNDQFAATRRAITLTAAESI